MTEEEALIYLSANDLEDAEEVYEEKLFELKQFFLNRFPVSKLIQSKLSTFEKVENALKVLGGSIADGQSVTLPELPKLETLQSAFNWYHKEKNTIRLQLLAAESHSDVQQVMKNYIQLARHYAAQWQIPLSEEDKIGLAIGAEPDAMEIQAELTAQKNSGEINDSFILSLPNENCLKSEAKRLSLWLKFETNE